MSLKSVIETNSQNPAHLIANPRLHFEVLHINNSPYYNNHIVGCIVKYNDIEDHKKFKKVRKIVLKECSENGVLCDKELWCFLYGKYVDVTRDLRKGDYIRATGFEVTSSLHFTKYSSFMYPYLIEIVDNSAIEKEAIVYISKMPIFRFDQLEMDGKCYTGICIVGSIVHYNDIEKDYTKRPVLKIILKEVLNDNCLGNLNLDCLIYDQLAHRYKGLNIGDIIKVSSFHVEARPSTSASEDSLTSYTFQIKLHPNNDEMPTVKVVKSATEKRPRPRTDRENSPKRHLSYHYTLLSDLKMDVKNGYNAKKRFHIYGVVVKACLHSIHVKECLEVELRDPTSDSFVVFIYQHSTAESFPDVHPYDIIRFHRVNLELNRNVLQGECYSPHNVLVFSGTEPNVEPIHTSRTFTLTSEDRRIVERLRSWSKPTNGTQRCGSNNQKRKISKQSTQTDFLTESAKPENCALQNHKSEKKIQSISEQNVDHLEPDTIADVDSDLVLSDSQSEHVLDVETNVIVHVPEYDLATDIEKDFQVSTSDTVPSLTNGSSDTIVRVSDVIRHQEKEVVLQNIDTPDNTCQKVEGNLLNNVNKTSSLLQFLDESELVEDEDSYDPKVIYKDIIHPLKLVTIPVGMENAPLTQIRHLKDMAPFSRSRVQARVVQMKPEPVDPNLAIYLSCNSCHYRILKVEAVNLTYVYSRNVQVFFCPKCQESNGICSYLECWFYIGLVLDDGTGQIDAYLNEEQATFFFQGRSAEHCSKNRKNLQIVIEKLWQISSLPTSSDNPPVVDCCLFKYKCSSGYRYNIVDTQLL